MLCWDNFSLTAGTDEGSSGGKKRDTIGPQGGSGKSSGIFAGICAPVCALVCSGIGLLDKQVF